MRGWRRCAAAVALLGLLAGGYALVRAGARAAPANARVRSLEAELAAVRAQSADDLARERGRIAELEGHVRELETELGLVQSERLEREMNFLDFTSAVATLAPDGPGGRFVRELLSDEPGKLESAPEVTPPESAEDSARVERSATMQRTLRALLAAEWVHGLDLLDIGLLDDGWIGPVVFRLVDDRGRLSGGLFAERLRLEGSASGRVVTLVLEEGSESHAGESVPFKHGVRRILLPGVDPAPFRAALPELFAVDRDPVGPDDAGFDLGQLQASLNRLLEEDATGEVFRLRHVGGVRGGVLRDVHVAVRDRDGRTLRHLFADSLSLAWLGEGVQLVLENGVSMRGDARAPFLDGRYRIFLPRARRAAWEAANLPGLVEPAADGPRGQ